MILRISLILVWLGFLGKVLYQAGVKHGTEKQSSKLTKCQEVLVGQR
jgi:hypothetical protein